MNFRIVQLTDCHLFADPTRELRGVHTWPRFLAACETIRNQFADLDCLVITGDIAHDDQAATYDAVKRELGNFLGRTLIIPGNHDERQLLHRSFAEGCAWVGDRLTFTRQLGEWRLIGLDSQLTGEGAGLVGDAQLDWLSEQLQAASSLNIMVFVHHPPIRVGSAWLDAIGLRDTDKLLSLVREFANVRGVICGHVHQECCQSIGATSVYTTPAIGPQFRPETVEPVIEDSPPGARLICLEPDGHWTTQVLRFNIHQSPTLPSE